jgi:hypothetical protein
MDILDLTNTNDLKAFYIKYFQLLSGSTPTYTGNHREVGPLWRGKVIAPRVLQD